MSKPTAPTPPSSGNGGAPAGGSGGAACCPTDFVLTPCRIVKVGGSLQISASELDGFSAGTYEWTSSSAKIRLTNPNSSTVTVEALANPSASREAEVITVTRTAAGCSPVTKTAKVTVAKVTFSAAAGQSFGYDDFDTPANTLDDHICVKKSDRTLLHVEIEGGATAGDFNFVCDDPAVCLPGVPSAVASFDLTLNAGPDMRAETTLHAKSKCPSAESFTQIQVHVYKEKVVEVVVAKIDATVAGSNLRFATADYAAHATPANDKLKEAVVKYEITNYDPANAATPVALAGGAATVRYDIAGGGGADLTAISTAMSGTGSKFRVAIVRDMVSVYFLKNGVKAGDTSFTVDASADSVFIKVGKTYPIDTGAKRESVMVTAVNGNVITCEAFANDHDAKAVIEYPAAGWSSDPILIKEGNATLDVTKWTILHEVGHSALNLEDIIDTLDFMHFSQATTDNRLRYCPRLKKYPAGTTNKENQWETIPRD